jgi:hypothetical protein
MQESDLNLDNQESAVSGAVDSAKGSPSMKVGMVKSYLCLAKSVLFTPGIFFSAMPVEGGYVQPGIFLLLSASVFALLQAISKLSPFILITACLSSIAGVLAASGIITLVCRGLGGKGNFQGTFRVLAYSKATLLFAWLALGPIPIGGIASLVYGVYLNIVGLEKVQQLRRWQLITITVLLALVGFVFKAKTGI